MSTIEDTDKIDLLTLSKDKKNIRLIAIETREWDSDPKMYKELNDKIDNYVNFIKGEQFFEIYPEFLKFKPNIIISVESIFEPSENAKNKFNSISRQLYNLGYKFEFNLLKTKGK